MKIVQSIRTADGHWSKPGLVLPGGKPANLVLLFGATDQLKNTPVFQEIRAAYPQARLSGCSTAGEIASGRVLDDTCVATAIAFEGTTIQTAETPLADATDSYDAGRRLVTAIPPAGLVHTLVFCDGLNVNGSELVRGIAEALPPGVAITGGLAGDGSRFQKTYVCAGGAAFGKRVTLLASYGNQLRVGYGSMGGWDVFGPERRITRSQGNLLYEHDDRPALDLYKEYVGPQAIEEPGWSLRFPMSVRAGETCEPVVRSCLTVNEKGRSMSFAGDMPEGALARLMYANADRLVDGSIEAAEQCCQRLAPGGAELALMISCGGRRAVLNQRIEEEIEAVRDVLGANAVTAGYYSYGEIAPVASGRANALHNETMTITTWAEI